MNDDHPTAWMRPSVPVENEFYKAPSKMVGNGETPKTETALDDDCGYHSKITGTAGTAGTLNATAWLQRLFPGGRLSQFDETATGTAGTAAEDAGASLGGVPVVPVAKNWNWDTGTGKKHSTDNELPEVSQLSQVSQQKNNDNRKHGVDAVSVFDLAIAWPEPPPGDLWPIGHKFPEPVARPEPSPPRTDPWAELEKLPLMDGDRAHIKKHLRGRSRADQAQLLPSVPM